MNNRFRKKLINGAGLDVMFRPNQSVSSVVHLKEEKVSLFCRVKEVENVITVTVWP